MESTATVPKTTPTWKTAHECSKAFTTQRTENPSQLYETLTFFQAV